MSALSLTRTTVHSRRAHPCQAVFVGPSPRPCPAAGQWRGPRERCGRHHSRHQLRCQASKDYYEILSVSPDASQKEIKSAYKQKALKLHPDVNKAPDARERFMECKIAYDTLGKPELRAEYDRKRRGGSFSGGWDFTDDPTWKRAAGAAEEFSFEDLLRELDMTFADWSRERKQKRGNKPYTVWDGLADVTDEFLSFLEDELGANEADQAKGASKAGPGASASSESGSSGQARREYTGTSYTASSSGTRAAGAADSGAKKKSDQEEIDEMLAEMKRKMGL